MILKAEISVRDDLEAFGESKLLLFWLKWFLFSDYARRLWANAQQHQPVLICEQGSLGRSILQNRNVITKQSNLMIPDTVV